ncbi:hypothetical protein B0T26DRAFT_731476 [Lasiosphaeria miniovina]|uniref:Uncharacterized protein n=1 Tax=Lasiosphaeria miniovina TaxID=1954250 RepID=A0AA39ZTU4_9PEZI|nr:uncharacterized protein B0T26DRAFT_731476 [Lasiosphaeria miniovina]KAK0703478.1 hypothetical protein B0T26DRAFT_731476 [Lasiosphaeria miniovina]
MATQSRPTEMKDANERLSDKTASGKLAKEKKSPHRDILQRGIPDVSTICISPLADVYLAMGLTEGLLEIQRCLREYLKGFMNSLPSFLTPEDQHVVTQKHHRELQDTIDDLCDVFREARHFRPMGPNDIMTDVTFGIIANVRAHLQRDVEIGSYIDAAAWLMETANVVFNETWRREDAERARRAAVANGNGIRARLAKDAAEIRALTQRIRQELAMHMKEGVAKMVKAEKEEKQAERAERAEARKANEARSLEEAKEG